MKADAKSKNTEFTERLRRRIDGTASADDYLADEDGRDGGGNDDDDDDSEKGVRDEIVVMVYCYSVLVH